MFMNALQAMSHMSVGRAASFADLKGTYDMMQHYLKALTMPAPRQTQVCHASHHGTQVCAIDHHVENCLRTPTHAWSIKPFCAHPVCMYMHTLGKCIAASLPALPSSATKCMLVYGSLPPLQAQCCMHMSDMVYADLTSCLLNILPAHVHESEAC